MIRRSAVRALLLADPDYVLLCRILIPDRDLSLWLTPGGGVEEGEAPEESLAREVFEETGYSIPSCSGPIWRRRHTFEFQGETYDQQEDFYLVRTPIFQPDHTRNPALVERDLIQEFRWWRTAEIGAADEVFVPGAMALHLKRLIREGPPSSPIEVGV